MPPVLAALPAILPGLLGAATVGTSIASMVEGPPGMPSAPVGGGPTTPGGPSQDQLKAVLAPQTSNILSSDPYASSTYLSTIAPQLAGAGGSPGSSNAMQSVLAQLFGGGSSSFTPSGSPTNLGGLASSPGISDYMSKIASTIA